MALIELRTLGTLDLHSAEGRELHSLLAQPKRLALLVYLCIAKPHGFHRRDTLLGVFWPNSDQEHARTSLRKSLHILRRALGDGAILSRGDEEVTVDFHLVSCDAGAFEASVKANRLEEALDLYRGDLLAGFFIDEAPEFDQWLDSERRRLRLCAARAALALSHQLEHSGNVPAAVISARRSLEFSDTDERALRKLIELQSRAGDRAEAIQTYETFARHLATEYQAEPCAETRLLIDRIRAGKMTFGSSPEAKAAEPERIAHGPVDPSSRLSTVSTTEREKGYSRRGKAMRYALGALAVVVFWTAIWGSTHPPSSKQVLRYTLAIDSSDALAPGKGWAGRIAISPDGSRWAYISGGVNGPIQQLAIRQRNELRATPVPATQDAFTPFFSPDGSNIGFLRQKSVWILSPTGGPPIQVSDSLTGLAGASWGNDGYIYVDGLESKPLARVEAKPKAAARWFTELDSAKGEFDHMWPSVLPNAKGVLFTVASRDKTRPDEIPSFAVAIADIPSGKHRIVIEDAAYPVYVSSGHVLYVTAERSLMVVPFDQNSMRVTGKPVA
ncbi:MAG: transcriptional activator protein, partial [Gemmatimonadales bacterium]|nr:transcriptional activator protein [Gemmatimonadales bacterium]